MSDGKLIVEIKNQRPVELVDLTRSLMAVADEYEGFADENLDGLYRFETKLYIQKIQTGSIITELVPHAAGLLPIISDANTVVAFAERLKKLFARLREPPTDGGSVDKRSLENATAILEPVAKDAASQLNITTKTEIHGPVTININSIDANAMQNQARKQLDLIRAPETGRHNKALMYWYQARNDMDSSAGDRAIIESISTKPVKVVFATDSIKGEMLMAAGNLFRYMFVVDVDVQTFKGKPALYTVLGIHERMEKPA